jgi:hypothetical protein
VHNSVTSQHRVLLDRQKIGCNQNSQQKWPAPSSLMSKEIAPGVLAPSKQLNECTFRKVTRKGLRVTGDQSRGLKVGDRVCWIGDKNDQGTVTEKNWAGVTIKWDNRSEQAILHNSMTQVDWVPRK